MCKSNMCNDSAITNKPPIATEKANFDWLNLDEHWNENMIYDNLCTSCTYWKAFICTFEDRRCIYESY